MRTRRWAPGRSSRRFIRFQGQRHPRNLGAPEINQFLTHLAVEGHVSASTQNQAFSALLFLDQKILETDPGRIEGALRAKRPKRLLGAFAGLSEGFPGSGGWHYATRNQGSAADVLIDDGLWRTYTHDFTTPLVLDGFTIGSNLRLMFEDIGPGVPGDVYFDNIHLSSLAAIPEPSGLVSAALGLAGLAGHAGWRRARPSAP